MPYALAEYQGSGEKGDAFRPVGLDTALEANAVDLRPDPSVAIGHALIWTPATVADPRVTALAEDRAEKMTTARRNRVANLLGANVSSSAFGEVFGTLLSSPPANRWKGLRPVRSRMRGELWVGPPGDRLLWAKAATLDPIGELIDPSDDFNRANGNVEVGVPAWTKRTGGSRNGQAVVSSNALDASGGADSYYHYAGAAATNDQYAEVTTANVEALPGGPAVRVNTTSLTQANGYNYDTFGTDGVFKCVADTFTLLAASSTAGPIPATLRVGVEGTTIELYVNGAANAPNYPLTDTTHSSGQPGFFVYGSGMDNWDGGDLNPVPPITDEAALRISHTPVTWRT